MEKDFIYIYIISFALGILLYSFFNLGWVFVCFVALLGLTVLACSSATVCRNHAVVAIAITLLAFAFGSARMLIAPSESGRELNAQIDESITVEGIIISEPDKRANYQNFVLKVQDVGEKILVRADIYTEFAYGDELRVEGISKKPKSFANEDDGRIFNYPRFLAKSNIYYIISYPNIEVLSHGHGNFIKRWLFAVKNSYLGAIERAIPEPASAVAGGITVGVKRALGDELETDFRKTGIIHIVVLSGYNIMIISTFILFLFTFVSRRVGAVLGSILIVLFAIMTGGNATVVRASAMGLLALFAAETGRTYYALRALAVVAFMMMLWNPKVLVADISFQLSFMATLGLMFGLAIFGNKSYIEPLYDVDKTITRARYSLRNIIVATISTQVAVLPLILYYMGDLSVVAVLVNILVLPAVPIAMLFVFFTGLLGIFSTPASLPLGWVSYLILEYILRVVDVFANMPFAALSIGSFSFFWVVVLYVLLVAFVVSLRHKFKLRKD